ncbi:putative Ubiquitin-conjugating enzyme family protein [Monocercomonoides exilis]|uniref:putative Ubiquitin-conjugating enzyme family protein n=1 Tax=Monocercomonoides exilis TaxID=2049356 RepID=UPI003559CF4C|nr:putative Ubiquitin-conjugating enzyme family protein [Monocercomonoides exilis]|eukprot:MONOS_9844.1-p1 / transcript=MONOS_9844.1 / gene=MONOS_9844 / organism=Monocercomonoides_exilis_PA203 / gene_product=Ubiquitin-conjugating enzyme family protein / transcript_product=Ubiquitin-conjugating enzyme family protein / location=Mono_scaffold00422:20093-20760(+) / protein_length=143 / sequence_SO=supercontig / SO=protein_coding / is_pseudo=false
MAQSTALPRSFRLLSELEVGEKDAKTGGGDFHTTVSFGVDGDDPQLHDWVGCIVGNETTQFAGRFYNLKIYCGEDYPKEPPTFQFVDRINIPCVDGSGRVVRDKLPYLKNWVPDNTIRGTLRAIADMMKTCPRTSQPPEGAKY